ncbi:MAG: type II toxin-antitoxin system prevent-host-death family antitoxin [Actinomycetota bacterium]|nr:type II toxin-antitoxin system prevent-host-death family antitoxin [Actinomycetota bacterium]MDP2287581.1 type II toxin-antitoxin system prevent-host-death family antitoxin [Actinomycetota bacterium]
MTMTVGVFEAKTKLSELLDKVAAGEEVIITKRGVPVAYLSGIEDRRARTRAAVAALRELSKQVKPGPESVMDLIEEGRSQRRW